MRLHTGFLLAALSAATTPLPAPSLCQGVDEKLLFQLGKKVLVDEGTSSD